MVVFKEEGRYPSQEEPQSPAVAEIDKGHGENVFCQTNPRYLRTPACGGGGQFRQVGGCNVSMIARVVAKVPGPRHQPEQTYRTEQHERAAPRNESQD